MVILIIEDYAVIDTQLIPVILKLLKPMYCTLDLLGRGDVPTVYPQNE